MGTAASLANILQTYGGWGVSGVLMATVWVLARHIHKVNEERLGDQRKHNEEMLHVVEKRVETDLKHAEAFKSLREIIARLIDRL